MVTVVYQTVYVCDGEHAGERPETAYEVPPSLARKLAERDGWRQIGGFTFCSTCSASRLAA